MNYRIELKTVIENDTSGRYPDIETIKESVDDYAKNERGFIVVHNSMHDYNYDMSLISGYDKIDTLGIIGIIQDTNIIDGKLFLDIKTNDNFVLTNTNLICFFRSMAKRTPTVNSEKFDIFHIIAIDLVCILEQDEIDPSKLSEVIELT